ncbi:nucleotidyltransferase family protein [Bacillus cereus]
MYLNTLGMEEQLIVLLSKQNLNEKEVASLHTLLHEYIDWSKVIGYLQLHRLSGIAWTNINKYYLVTGKEKPTYNGIIKFLKQTHKLQELRVKEHIKHTIQICKDFQENNINYILMKGAVLSCGIYNDLGSRDFGDTDILIHRQDISKVTKMLKEKGYIQGIENKKSGLVESASRREVMMRPLVSHEIYPFIKSIEDSAFLDTHYLDIHFSIDLLTTNKTDDAVQQMLEEAISIPFLDSHISSFNWEDMLIFLCQHFYKEATSKLEILAYRDLGLYKLCDIQYLINNKKDIINWDVFVQKTIDGGFIDGVYYSLYLTSQVYNCVPPQDILEKLRPNNLGYLNQYIDEKQRIHEWNDNGILSRFFDFNRVAQISRNEK